MMLLVSSLFVGLAMSASTVAEISALRDDMIHLCHKAYGGKDSGQKNCRQNQHITASPNSHVTFKCYKSGWSGSGKLKCLYGAEAFDGLINMNNPGDNAVHEGAQESGRRRMMSSGEDDDVFADEEEDATEESKWENQLHPVSFELENIEDEKEVTSLGDVAVCFLQGVEYIPTEDESVQSKCTVEKNADGIWELHYTSAKCQVMCFPHGATRMF